MRFRNAALLYAALAFIWLQLEDNHVLPVALLGAAGALLLFVGFMRRRVQLAGDGARALLGAALGGALAGGGAAVVTALLMVLKAGMHGHAYPDYPPGQILALLGLAPVWSLAGGLGGLGLALLARGLRVSP